MDTKEINRLTKELISSIDAIKRLKFNYQCKTDLKRSERFILWLISTMDGKSGVMPSQIANKLGVTLAAVTHHVNRLAEAGYIERIESESDKRSVFLKLTKFGRSENERLRRHGWNHISRLVEYLGEKDSQKLLEIHQKVCNFIEKHQERQ